MLDSVHHNSAVCLPTCCCTPSRDDLAQASKVDPTAWRLEVERVAPRLRITLNANAKDWRSHLEEVQSHSKVGVVPCASDGQRCEVALQMAHA